MQEGKSETVIAAECNVVLAALKDVEFGGGRDLPELFVSVFGTI